MGPDLTTLLQLISVKGVGPATIRARLNDAHFVLNEYKKLNKVNTQWAESVLERCIKEQIEIIPFYSPIFPAKLLSIKDCPTVLYCKGDLALLNSERVVSVVGTRKASEYGLRAAKKIAYNLSSEKFVIVSGMALGIDREVHIGSIEGGSPGIAVLASGVERATPSSNGDIYHALLNAGGLIISEHEPGFPVVRTELVKRNRIQSGISSHTIIIETGETGGTITQAKYAKEQERPILTMIANSESPSSFNCDYSGSNRLVSEFNAIGFASWEELKTEVFRD